MVNVFLLKSFFCQNFVNKLFLTWKELNVEKIELKYVKLQHIFYNKKKLFD